MMSKAKRMHPAATILNFFKILKDLIVPAVLGFFATLRNINLGGFWLEILYIVVIILILLTYSYLSWYRFTYRVENEELRIEYGILVRKKRYISKSRIQSIDLTAGIIHRIFGLVKVEVQTAGSDNSAEGALKAVKREEGEALRSALKELSAPTNVPEEYDEKTEEPGPSYKISLKRLLIAATTSGGIGVFLSVFAIFGSQINQIVPEDFFVDAYNWVTHLSIVIIVTLGIIVGFILWLMAIAGTFLKYSYFTISKKNEEIFITRGLLEKKQLTVPLKKIQAVRIQESMLRQPFGFATVYAEVAGGSSDKGEDFSTVLFPLLRASEVEAFIKELIPSYQTNLSWNRLPKRSARRFITRAAIPVVIPLIPLVYFFPKYSWIGIILLAVTIVFGYISYRDAGHVIKGNQLSFRSRFFNRNTIIAHRKRIQALSGKENWFQKRQSLRTSQFSVASNSGSSLGKSFKVKDMEAGNSGEIMKWYSYR